jgi:hypothetical protein
MQMGGVEMAEEATTSGTKIRKYQMVKCDVCSEEIKKTGLKMHKIMKHGEPAFGLNAVLADYKAKLEAAEAEIKTLKSQSQQVEKPAVDDAPDKLAALADWIDSLNREAWEAIGKQKGYLPEVALEKPAAVVADPAQGPHEPQPLPATTMPVRHVFLAEHGISIKLKK